MDYNNRIPANGDLNDSGKAVKGNKIVSDICIIIECIKRLKMLRDCSEVLDHSVMSPRLINNMQYMIKDINEILPRDCNKVNTFHKFDPWCYIGRAEEPLELAGLEKPKESEDINDIILDDIEGSESIKLTGSSSSSSSSIDMILDSDVIDTPSADAIDSDTETDELMNSMFKNIFAPLMLYCLIIENCNKI